MLPAIRRFDEVAFRRRSMVERLIARSVSFYKFVWWDVVLISNHHVAKTSIHIRGYKGWQYLTHHCGERPLLLLVWLLHKFTPFNKQQQNFSANFVCLKSHRFIWLRSVQSSQSRNKRLQINTFNVSCLHFVNRLHISVFSSFAVGILVGNGWIMCLRTFKRKPRICIYSRTM